MDWTKINQALGHLTQPTYLYIAVAALVLILLLIMRIRRQPQKIVAYQTENGRVMICRSAIIELVRNVCEHLDDITKPSVKIRCKGHCTHLDVRLKLITGAHLKDIERTLQAQLRQGLNETLGIERIGRINIVAVGLKSGPVQISRPILTAGTMPAASTVGNVNASDSKAVSPSANQDNEAST